MIYKLLVTLAMLFDKTNISLNLTLWVLIPKVLLHKVTKGKLKKVTTTLGFSFNWLCLTIEYNSPYGSHASYEEYYDGE